MAQISQIKLAAAIHDIAKSIESRRMKCKGFTIKNGFDEYPDGPMMRSEPNGEIWVTLHLQPGRKRGKSKKKS
jgi:hypothetical protein